MAIAIDADLGTTDGSGGATRTLTTTAAAVANSRVIVFFSYFSSTTPSDVTIGGVAATLDKRVTNGSDKFDIWSLHVAAGLASSSAIVIGGTMDGGWLIGAVSFTGVDATGSPVDTTSSNATTGTGWSSGAASNAAADALFIGGAGNEAVATTVAYTAINGTKIHDRYRAADLQGFGTAYTIASSVASRSVSGTWASTSTATTGALVIYKAALTSGPMAPPARVGTVGAAVFTATNVLTPTTLQPSTGSGYAIGDLLLCYTACRSATPTVATPSGWTLLVNTTGTNGRMALFGKIATVTNETAPDVTWSSLTTGTSGTPAGAQCAAFSGLQILEDVEGTASNGIAGTATSVGGTTITTLVKNSVVISMTTRLDDAFTTFTAPSGFTLVAAAVGSASGLDFAMAWAWQLLAAPGAATTPLFGLTGASSFASSGVMTSMRAKVSYVTPHRTSRNYLLRR